MSDLNSLDSMQLIDALESMVQGLRELREFVSEESLASEMVDLLIEKGKMSIDLAQCKVIH